MVKIIILDFFFLRWTKISWRVIWIFFCALVKYREPFLSTAMFNSYDFWNTTKQVFSNHLIIIIVLHLYLKSQERLLLKSVRPHFTRNMRTWIFWKILNFPYYPFQSDSYFDKYNFPPSSGWQRKIYSFLFLGKNRAWNSKDPLQYLDCLKVHKTLPRKQGEEDIQEGERREQPHHKIYSFAAPLFLPTFPPFSKFLFSQILQLPSKWSKTSWLSLII